MDNQNVNAPDSVPPSGYSDATVVGSGRRLVFLGGHVSYDRSRQIVHPGDLPAQVEQALENLRNTLAAAGGNPEDLVKLTIHVVGVGAWRSQLEAIGVAWQKTLGKVYPATTLLGVEALFDTAALVEIDGVAALPTHPTP